MSCLGWKSLCAAIALLVAGVSVGLAADLEISPKRPDAAVHAVGDGSWEVMPERVGLGRLIQPSLEARRESSIPYSASSIIEIEVSSDQPLVAGLHGLQPNETREVFPLQSLDAGEGVKAWWAVEDRVGMGVDLDGVALSLGVRSDDPTTATVHAIRLLEARSVGNDVLLAASLYAPLTLQYHEPTATQQQEALVSLPEEFARRHREEALVLADAQGETLATIDIANPPAGQVGVYQWQVGLVRDATPGSGSDVRLLLRSDNGQEREIASARWRVPPAERGFRQFEFPFQSIVDFDVRQMRPDLGLIVVVRDFGTRDEPEGLHTASHEVHAATVSLRSSLFETQPAWRVPASVHWAAAGFQSVVTGYIRNTSVFFISGVDEFGMESTGFASTVGRSPVRPAVVNPVFWPDDESTGWMDGMSLLARGNALVMYRRSYLMLTVAQAGDQKPRLVASTSPDLRLFADAGVVPFDGDLEGHVSAYEVDGTYYLFTDDTSLVWVSTDPLRAWSSFPVEMPAEWTRLRIRDVDDVPHLFGLYEVAGKSVVRWMPVTFEGEDTGLPTIAASP